MKHLPRTILAGALLIGAPAFANEAHHQAGAAAEPPVATDPAPPQKQSTGMMINNSMMGGMDSSGMISNDMRSDGMMKMVMNMMSGGEGPMGQMMSPDRVEGRIAFLATELKLTDAQQPLWKAVADALRANAKAAKEMMASMPAGMMSAETGGRTPLERIALQERMLSARLGGLHRLETALKPFYSELDDTQRSVADKLLMPAPMGMM
jgi:LTXXQ motif family protein